MNACKFLVLAITLSTQLCIAGEELVTTAQEKNESKVPYILNYDNLSPNYVIILFPGGHGMMNPHIEDGKLVYQFRGNFLIRARKFIVDQEFATVATNSTRSEDRIQAILDDLKRRFPAAQIYLMGTSNGTFDTMALAGYLSDKIAGEIHTSSLRGISAFNAKEFKNRHLVLHHRADACHATPFAAAEASHQRYGNEFIAIEGGISVGDPCEAFAHHGYNGIESSTIDAIKGWIKQSARPQGSQHQAQSAG